MAKISLFFLKKIPPYPHGLDGIQKILIIMKPIHVIASIVGGAVAGATVGLLLAPEKGEDVRKKIMDVLKEKGICLKKSKMEKLVDEIEDKIEENI